MTKLQFIIDHMSRDGSKRHLLTIRQWGFVWLLGDGLGKITTELDARRKMWDLSHVTESGDEALTRMFNAISKFALKGS